MAYETWQNSPHAHLRSHQYLVLLQQLRGLTHAHDRLRGVTSVSKKFKNNRSILHLQIHPTNSYKFIRFIEQLKMWSILWSGPLFQKTFKNSTFPYNQSTISGATEQIRMGSFWDLQIYISDSEFHCRSCQIQKSLVDIIRFSSDLQALSDDELVGRH